MKRKNIDEIKKLESKPKIVKIFTDKEINSNYNKPLDELYISKIGQVLDDYKMDNLISEKNEDFLGLFHESFSPLKLHVDSGFNEKDIIYKQVVTPLTPIGETVVFKNRLYGKSTSFTIDE